MSKVKLTDDDIDLAMSYIMRKLEAELTHYAKYDATCVTCGQFIGAKSDKTIFAERRIAALDQVLAERRERREASPNKSNPGDW